MVSIKMNPLFCIKMKVTLALALRCAAFRVVYDGLLPTVDEVGLLFVWTSYDGVYVYSRHHHHTYCHTIGGCEFTS